MKVINKSRQGIPVRVVSKGKQEVVHLRAVGEASMTTTERITDQLQNLIDKGLVVIRDLESAKPASKEAVAEEVRPAKAKK